MWVKNALTALVVAAIAAVAGCGGSEAQNAETTATPKLQVVHNDVPYRTDTYLRIGYTLKMWEYEKDNLELQKIVVRDDVTKTELMVIEKADLPRIWKDPLVVPYPADKIDHYYLSLQLPIPSGQTPPTVVSHRFIFKSTQTAQEVSMDGAVFSPRLSETPLLISSPLRGKNLVYFNQSTNDYHFHMMAFANGRLYGLERYAFDSLEFNDNLTAFYSGDPALNSSYFNYGKTLYAVADGTVVKIQDGLAENSGNTGDVASKITVNDEFAGNYIMIDLGGGRYATYMHCIPGNFLVNVGDHVSEGQPIGLLGNSGGSTAPHLHFQISDSMDLTFTDGVPFVLKEYTKVGEFSDIPSLLPSSIVLPPVRVRNAMMEQFTAFNVE